MTADPVNYPKLLHLLGEMYLSAPVPEAVQRWQRELSDQNHDLADPLKKGLTAIGQNPAEQVELETEYARLFVGPASLPCPPWESVYTSPGGQMMQEANEEMKSLYLDAGLAVKAPDLADHMGAELQFLALLLGRAAEPESLGDKALRLADRLLDEHLNRWSDRFTRDLEAAARSPLYSLLAATTRRVLERLQSS